MLKRTAAFIFVLLLASQAMARGIVRGADAISRSFNHTEEAACPIQNASEGHAVDCCAHEKSPTWTLAAMMCCEVKCGESTGGAEFEFAPQTLISEDRVLIVRTILLDAMGEAETAVVSIKSAAYKLLHHDPPDLYLFNSMFLI
jgi:hypothetical protein